MPTWLIPSWAPNFHPLVIHFPIVLVKTAAVVDLVDVAFERSAWLKAATTTLYVTGALSLIVAFLTGLQAQGTVLIPGMAYPVLAEHRQWALITMTYCTVSQRCDWWCCAATAHAVGNDASHCSE
jgi:uncharacterized membrane protein